MRLGVRQEQMLRAWPKDRIRPKSVALGVISLLAEVEALRDERDAAARRLAELERALDQAGKDFVNGHYHIAERLDESDYSWLMDHLEESFGRVCDALRAPGRGGEGEATQA